MAQLSYKQRVSYSYFQTNSGTERVGLIAASEGVRNVLLTVTVLARGRADVQQEVTVLNVLLIVTVLERVRTVVQEDPVLNVGVMLTVPFLENVDLTPVENLVISFSV